MNRRIPGLSQSVQREEELPEGEYLVQVTRIKYRWHAQKPYYTIQFEVIEPAAFRMRSFSCRLYCSVKALWKFSWFLKDFAYDPDLLGSDEIDEKAVVGLTGIVKISNRNGADGHAYPALDTFAPAERWVELQAGSPPDTDDDRQVA